MIKARPWQELSKIQRSTVKPGSELSIPYPKSSTVIPLPYDIETTFLREYCRGALLEGLAQASPLREWCREHHTNQAPLLF